MSVLLIGISGEPGRALIRRLVAQSDEVRVIENDPGPAGEWTSLGAYVAHGPPTDADLIERAAQNVRTVVVMQRRSEDFEGVLRAVVEGAPRGARRGEDVRVVVCGSALDPAGRALSAAGVDHVLLRTGGRRLPGRGIAADDLAEAVDAADDLAGNPRLDLDLTRSEAWERLRLRPPSLR